MNLTSTAKAKVSEIPRKKKQERPIVQVEEKLPILRTLPLSFQHLFAMFGATVIVPCFFKVNPSIALFMNGIGTLVYLFVSGWRIPSYLGSSFAFVAPVLAIMASPEMGGYGGAQGAFIGFGVFFIIVSLIIRFTGVKWINSVFPPAAMGSIVLVIGLELAPIAARLAGFIGPGSEVGLQKGQFVALFTVSTTILSFVLLRGFLSAIPILIGVICGYTCSVIIGLVDFGTVYSAPWFVTPTFYKPSFSMAAVFIMMPAYFVTLAEHIGHLVVTGNIVGRDFIKNPGLDRSLLGDGISNILSGFAGATANTTYGENMGVLAITRVYSTWVLGGAACLAVAISFIGKVSALIRSIPEAVMGGVSMLLFGVIATAGIRLLIEEKVDFTKPTNLILTAFTLIVGLSGIHIHCGVVEIKGMALSTFAAILLSLLFSVFRKFGWLNE
jgi:uracil permease